MVFVFYRAVKFHAVNFRDITARRPDSEYQRLEEKMLPQSSG